VLSILTVYVFSATGFREISRLPLLIEHFTEHRQHNRNITFAGFLSMHYHDLHEHGTENDTDKNLPFKSPEGAAGLNFVCSFLQSPVFSFIPAESGLCGLPIIKEEFLYAAFSANIWQPPKLL
jgi:hypothetical protein